MQDTDGPSDATALLGSWRMLSWTGTFVDGGGSFDALGPDPIGYIAYHADGRMMATVFARHRVGVDGAPSATDKVALYDSMLAYVARYTLEGDTVTHHVEGAWNPTWEVALSRPFKLDGDRLVISGAPSTDPATGREVIYRMEFTRVGAAY